MTTIKLKNGSGAPTAGDLAQGEPALDLTNKRLYTEDSGGTVIEVGTNPGTDVTFADNRKAIFGAGSDLQIYHDGGTSRIVDSGTGNLIIAGTELGLMNAAQTTYHLFAQDGGDVRLGYNGSYKLATTSTGIDVTGTVVADGLESSGGLTFTAADGIDISGKESVVVRIDSDDNDAGRVFQVLSGPSASQEILIQASEDAGVSLYYDNAAKLATTSTGIDVTGNTLSDSLTANGSLSALNAGSVMLDYNGSSVSRLLAVGADATTTGTLKVVSTASDGGPYIEALTVNSSGIDVTGTVTSTSYGSQLATTLFEQNVLKSSVTASSGAFVRMAVSSASNPTYAFEDDTDTGVFTSGANTLNFGTAGTERLRIDSSGQVGIGTSNPDTSLHVTTPSGTKTELNLAQTAVTNYRLSIPASTDALTFVYGASTERMRIDSNGNVGIGNTSPSAKFTNYKNTSISGSAGATLSLEDDSQPRMMMVADSSTSYISSFDSNPITFSVTAGNFSSSTGTERMRIDSSGNVGIGTSSPQAYLHVYGNNAETLRLQGNDEYTYLSFRGTVGTEQTFGYLGFANDTGTAADLNLTNSQAGAISFSANGSERMRIDSSGNLLVGTTDNTLYNNTTGDGIRLSNGGEIQIANTNDIPLWLNRMGTDGVIVTISKSGTAVGSISVTSSATTYNTSSDQRLKDNIVDAPSASDDIDAIQVRSFDWKADGSHQKYGMVAQELQSVAPEAVSGDADSDDMMGVDYSKLVPMLVKEIQSLRARVAQLEGEN